MTGAQYIVDSLIRKGVTDAFGIPGGVILRLIYEMDNRNDEIMPHLSYHEQSAGFAACGYAQASRTIGVAYASRGPGFTNLTSAIADAYYDSLPVLFITAHTASCPPDGMRVMDDQEMDTCSIVKNITKDAVRADDAETFADIFEQLCNTALEGRKGPVLLDVSTKILNQEITEPRERKAVRKQFFSCKTVCRDISESIRAAKRPVVLVGDGIHQIGAEKLLHNFVKNADIPVISSRFSHDLLGKSDYYFGYVGSHGTRCSNFILSKTDLIIALGNRLHFPVASQTFGEIFKHARLIRCEIDEGEMKRVIPNSTCYHIDVAQLLGELAGISCDYGRHESWMQICSELKKELHEEDMNEPARMIADILSAIPLNWSIVTDVGNNEFWVSRASVYNQEQHRTFYSKSFATLGCGLGKAIGIYYSTRMPVVCFIGDQGIQMNIQELLFMTQHQLPIFVMLINNSASGMIRDREKSCDRFLHTTKNTGFGSPCYRDIARGYGMNFHLFSDVSELKALTSGHLYPTLVEIVVDEEIGLLPNLPKGAECQNMHPKLAKDKYDYLNHL